MIRSKLSILCGILATAISLSSAQALEEREFFNADKTKSFKGTVVAYDPETKKVSIRTSGGAFKKAPISALSAEDQKYIKENEELLAAISNLDFKFTEVKNGTQTSYDILLHNRSKSNINNIKLKYTLHFKHGSIQKGVAPVAKTHSGEVGMAQLYAGFSDKLSTDSVTIMRKIVKGKPGG